MYTLPLSRNLNIVVQPLGKELLIYDLTTHKAYCLNETCAAVFQACDGETSFAECRRRNNFTDDVIYLALDELRRENLLENSNGSSAAAYRSPFESMSRREAIRKVGMASMIALPTISSLIAPTAVMAQSGGSGDRTLGETCTSSAECASSAPNCTGGTCCVSTLDNRPSGTASQFFDNGTCSSSDDICNSRLGFQCCSGSASAEICNELQSPGTVFVRCVCN